MALGTSKPGLNADSFHGPQTIAYALAMVLEGYSRTDAAQMNGMDRQTLRDWVHRYNADGVPGLISRLTSRLRSSLATASRPSQRGPQARHAYGR